MTHRATTLCLLLTALFSVSSCTRPTFAGKSVNKVDEAVKAFEQDSTLASNEEALFVVAMAKSTPHSAYYNPAEARALLGRFVTSFPQSTHLEDARRASDLLAAMKKLEEEQSERDAQIRTLTLANDSLNARLNEQKQAVDQLQAELRKRVAQLHAIELELQELKALDHKLLTSRKRSQSVP